MTEDILEVMEKRRQVKSTRENYKTLHKEILRKCNEVKEKCIIDMSRNIDLDHRST